MKPLWDSNPLYGFGALFASIYTNILLMYLDVLEILLKRKSVAYFECIDKIHECKQGI